jgi:hypothetical protein
MILEGVAEGICGGIFWFRRWRALERTKRKFQGTACAFGSHGGDLCRMALVDKGRAFAGMLVSKRSIAVDKKAVERYLTVTKWEGVDEGAGRRRGEGGGGKGREIAHVRPSEIYRWYCTHTTRVEARWHDPTCPSKARRILHHFENARTQNGEIGGTAHRVVRRKTACVNASCPVSVRLGQIHPHSTHSRPESRTKPP